MSFNNKIKCDWCKFEGRRNELFVINEIFYKKEIGLLLTYSIVQRKGQIFVRNVIKD